MRIIKTIPKGEILISYSIKAPSTLQKSPNFSNKYIALLKYENSCFNTAFCYICLNKTAVCFYRILS